LAPGVATKVIAATFGLTAFAVGIVAGLLAGNPPETILMRALLALVGGQIFGLIVGSIGERTVAEALAASEKYGKSEGAKPPAVGAPAAAGAEFSS
jgi:hypothetical protein